MPKTKADLPACLGLTRTQPTSFRGTLKLERSARIDYSNLPPRLLHPRVAKERSPPQLFLGTLESERPAKIQGQKSGAHLNNPSSELLLSREQLSWTRLLTLPRDSRKREALWIDFDLTIRMNAVALLPFHAFIVMLVSTLHYG